MDLERAVDLVRSFEFKGGMGDLGFQCMCELQGDHVLIGFKFFVTPVGYFDRVREPISKELRVGYGRLLHMSEEWFLEYCINEIKAIWMHELKESIFVEGKQFYYPHPEEVQSP